MPKISIRAKLLLLSVALLSIPYIGFRYLRETERYLQSSLEESLRAISGSLAVLLGQYPNPFQSSLGEQHAGEALFVHSLKHPVQLDGYADDWINYLEWSNSYGVRQKSSGTGGDLSYKIILGEYQQDLYVLIQVKDADPVYQQDSGFQPYTADAVEMVFSDPKGNIQNYFFSTAAPGSVTAYRIVENWDFSTTRQSIANVIGQWQETPDGYTLEIRVPLYLVGDAMGFTVYDAGNNSGASYRVGTAGRTTDIRPNKLIQTSVQLDQLLQRLELKPGRRAWVLNRQGQVLASGGSLMSEVKRGAINILYTWILPRATDNFEDDLAGASRLRGKEVLEALSGHAASRWRSSPDERAVIVSAASPVRLGNELIGVVVVEETTNSIQTLQRRAMADLFNKSILVFVISTVLLLVFATRLSVRLVRLRNDAEQAIDPHGRVVGTITGSTTGDEIGDLSRSFAAMLDRLHQYNAYSEGMASKLADELGAPLAVAKSSLENLERVSDEANHTMHLHRARDEIARLDDLVRRLGEAALLEQSIKTCDVEEFDMTALLAGCVEAYKQAYPGNQFNFIATAPAPWMVGAPELVAQMFDKLIENAVDFSAAGGAIEIELSTAGDGFFIDISNHGPGLPEDMRGHLFGSLVSVRGRDQSRRAHLGLGLYIVRLVMEFHRGKVTAEDLAAGDGVRFRLEFPAGAKPTQSSSM